MAMLVMAHPRQQRLDELHLLRLGPFLEHLQAIGVLLFVVGLRLLSRGRHAEDVRDHTL